MPIPYGVVLRRALLAGVVAGALVAAFYLLVARPTLDAAIAWEQAVAEDGQGHAHDEPFSRRTQAVGGALAALIYGAVLGLVLGTVLAATRSSLRCSSDLRRSLTLAAAGFVATALVPAIAYPSSPPGIGDPDTVGARTLQHLTLVAAGVVLAVGLGLLHRRLGRRVGGDSALALTIVAAVVGYVGLIALWPDDPVPVPAGFPAGLLWDFRVQSLASLALLWGALGLGLGWALSRLEGRHAPLASASGAPRP